MSSTPVYIGKLHTRELKVKAGAAPAPLLTIDEVADRCHCSRRHIQSQIEAGHLAVIKIGKLTRIDSRDLDEYLHDRKSGGTRPVAGGGA